GLTYATDGPRAASLHLGHARALAGLGDSESAVEAIRASEEAADRAYVDDVHDEFGGEFACSQAYLSYLAGSTLADLPSAEDDAVTVLRRATVLYGEAPPEQRSYGVEAISHANLARVEIRAGRLDNVDLGLVFGLSPDKRINALVKALAGVRRELAAPRYQGNATAADLDERIEAFIQDTVTRDLRELS
ncbi:MAG TPA: hypothetical protein VHJ17_21815, partial [Thermomonospora sp.]|nr:hypothetical protein [Thermomonospora sp.]